MAWTSSVKIKFSLPFFLPTKRFQTLVFFSFISFSRDLIGLNKSRSYTFWLSLEKNLPSLAQARIFEKKLFFFVLFCQTRDFKRLFFITFFVLLTLIDLNNSLLYTNWCYLKKITSCGGACIFLKVETAIFWPKLGSQTVGFHFFNCRDLFLQVWLWLTQRAFLCVSFGCTKKKISILWREHAFFEIKNKLTIFSPETSLKTSVFHFLVPQNPVFQNWF